MSAINKELYDAFIAANVDEPIAAKAAASVEDGTEVKDELNSMDKRLGVVEVKLGNVEHLTWVLVGGMLISMIKDFF